MHWLIHLIGRLPLKYLQSVGAFLGLLTYWFSPKDKALILENLSYAQALYSFNASPKEVAKSAGKMLTDSLWIWQHPKEALKKTELIHWDVVEQAMEEGKGLLMLTPHLGAFEMIPRVLAEHFPATIIYKPAKQAWLNDLIEEGRAHPRMNFVPANMQGVRQIARALVRGEAVGILPDQVPGNGEGVWAPFFGKPAYTAVLPAKIALKNNIPTIVFSAIRKPDGDGWSMIAQRISEPFSSDSVTAATQLNHFLEQVIIQNPEQYLWMYKRYKHPAGAPPPPPE
ncbi:acyltransferase [Polynucleobacter sp. SHI8]|uniref:lysophospholipid acyltransferase family protein n=1 Tax=unclassified Polynucleobacter TaxID=2640945 RepID=UPI0024939B68|nr:MULTISPECIES: lysophospholipid acyltransferase family protein [unclassified Polynucleobacter]BDW12216.1 acyltransferase [Polynucleobacter sp. SHI2]BDW14664.1 acyltransferase [Polynucleobacter sp. SHI8]